MRVEDYMIVDDSGEHDLGREFPAFQVVVTNKSNQMRPTGHGCMGKPY